MAQIADVAIVFVSANSGEQYIIVDGNEGDRNNLSLWNNANNLVSLLYLNKQEKKKLMICYR